MTDIDVDKVDKSPMYFPQTDGASFDKRHYTIHVNRPNMLMNAFSGNVVIVPHCNDSELTQEKRIL